MKKETPWKHWEHRSPFDRGHWGPPRRWHRHRHPRRGPLFLRFVLMFGLMVLLVVGGMAALASLLARLFGGGTAEGNTTMKELLGGKGANLAEMAGIGVPVPPGFTITTEVCNEFTAAGGEYPDGLKDECRAAMDELSQKFGLKFADPEGTPLLVSVRSGARASMPGIAGAPA